MDIKKHAFQPCTFHQNHRFSRGCHECLVNRVVRLCELLDEDPNVGASDDPAVSNGLAEVFAGTQVAHFTEGRITNVTALPMSPADHEEGIFRYTVEIRKDNNA